MNNCLRMPIYLCPSIDTFPCGVARSPIGRLPRWWIGECLLDIGGTEEIKYSGRTKTRLRMGSSTLSIILKHNGNDPGMVQY